MFLDREISFVHLEDGHLAVMMCQWGFPLRMLRNGKLNMMPRRVDALYSVSSGVEDKEYASSGERLEVGS